ncbi:hypothetical protein LOAG_00240 [Loa loa]|uniref:Uncharacterized protein n=1 Tax=Loa loa TaxID=7209 RepID=A0A1S0UBN2_LOALO|nr:hypothetical protein LOAG_00240 [Loa loa]EFO28245.1 hypothetical protein LOAG_00240 [Loa loa]
MKRSEEEVGKELIEDRNLLSKLNPLHLCGIPRKHMGRKGSQTFKPNALPLLAVGLNYLLPLKSSFYVIIADIRENKRAALTDHGEDTVLSDYFPPRHTEAVTSRPSASIPQIFLQKDSVYTGYQNHFNQHTK